MLLILVLLIIPFLLALSLHFLILVKIDQQTNIGVQAIFFFLFSTPLKPSWSYFSSNFFMSPQFLRACPHALKSHTYMLLLFVICLENA